MKNFESMVNEAKERVKKNANHTDQLTGCYEESLHAHHILPRALFRNRAADDNNLIALSSDIHLKLIHGNGSIDEYFHGKCKDIQKKVESLHALGSYVANGNSRKIHDAHNMLAGKVPMSIEFFGILSDAYEMIIGKVGGEIKAALEDAGAPMKIIDGRVMFSSFDEITGHELDGLYKENVKEQKAALLKAGRILDIMFSNYASVIQDYLNFYEKYYNPEWSEVEDEDGYPVYEFEEVYKSYQNDIKAYEEYKYFVFY